MDLRKANRICGRKTTLLQADARFARGMRARLRLKIAISSVVVSRRDMAICTFPTEEQTAREALAIQVHGELLPGRFRVLQDLVQSDQGAIVASGCSSAAPTSRSSCVACPAVRSRLASLPVHPGKAQPPSALPREVLPLLLSRSIAGQDDSLTVRGWRGHSH